MKDYEKGEASNDELRRGAVEANDLDDIEDERVARVKAVAQSREPWVRQAAIKTGAFLDDPEGAEAQTPDRRPESQAMQPPAQDSDTQAALEDGSERTSSEDAASDPAAATVDAAACTLKMPLTEKLTLAASKFLRFLKERDRRHSLSEVPGQKAVKRGQLARIAFTLAGIVVFFLVVNFWYSSTQVKKVPPVKTFVSDWKTAPASVDRESFQTQYEGRLDTLTDKVAGLVGTIDELNARIARLKADAARETTRQKDERMKAEEQAREMEALVAAPPAGTPPGQPLSAEDAQKLLDARKKAKPRLAVVSLVSGEFKTSESERSVAVFEHPIGRNLNRQMAETPLARNRAQGIAPKTYLPAGTFMKAVVLSGVTASTGGTAAANPMPLLLEVTDTAHLPNDFRGAVQRCFVTASATGDLSSERVLVRLDRLSCMKKDGKAVDVRVQGYVTGEDGKTGVRARLVTRSGQAIANAVFLGALSGLGDAVSLSAQSTTTYAAGSTASVVKNPWKAGLGEGMSDAMDRIVDYYLKLADKIFPVLELDGGRTVEVVLSQGVTVSEKAGGEKEPERPETFSLDSHDLTRTLRGVRRPDTPSERFANSAR